MANTNFVTAIAPAMVIEFKDTVIKQAKENDVILMDRKDLGNGQSWSLKGLDKPKPSVIGYESGQIVWQNLNPTRIGIECKFIKKWANTQ
jgi:hypothetical protein